MSESAESVEVIRQRILNNPAYLAARERYDRPGSTNADKRELIYQQLIIQERMGALNILAGQGLDASMAERYTTESEGLFDPKRQSSQS